MRTLLLAVASLALVAGPALAQGDAPDDAFGSQAGGPRAGIVRVAAGRTMEQGAMARRRTLAARRFGRKRRTTQKLGGGPL